MKVQIRSRKLVVDGATEAHVERRLHFALGRFSDVVERVDVTLADINGPNGGQDKLCRIRVRLRNESNPIIAEVLHEELLTGTDMAVDRIGRSVARAVDRRSGLRINRRRRALSAAGRGSQFASA